VAVLWRWVAIKVSVVCVDNGEELAEECLRSIRAQGVDELIVVPSPRSRVGVLEKYADRVTKPAGPVGYARYVGLTASSNRIVAFCDTDTVYGDKYFEHAVEDFARDPELGVVKAGVVLPHKPSLLGHAESLVHYLAGAYEFGWVVDRDKVLEALSSSLGDVELLKRSRVDFGMLRSVNSLKSLVDRRMVVRTRLPTYFFSNYSPAVIGTATPLVAVSLAVVGGWVLGKKH
jgi:glycosyltransferase involved in cell wall biosynthesis